MSIPRSEAPIDRIYPQLLEPFAPELVELKPGAVSEARKSALALAYVDARHYMARLDAVAGPGYWQVSYTPWGERAVICSLTVCGVTRQDVGEAEKGDPNQATSAAMQAFKRTCAAFGLGRYLYTDLPQMWVDAEQKGRSWVISNQRQTVEAMYQQAGIDVSRRGVIVRRIVRLFDNYDDAQLIEIGKQISQTSNDK